MGKTTEKTNKKTNKETNKKIPDKGEHWEVEQYFTLKNQVLGMN